MTSCLIVVVVVAVLVLGGDEHRVDGDRSAVFVGDRHLGLAVGPQIGHLAGAANLGEPHRESVRQPDRQRHEVVVVVAGVAEHHALVARAERVQLVLAAGAATVLERDVDAAGDVGTLLVERDQHRAVLAVEALRAVVVADVEDRLARRGRDVDDGARGDLTGDDAQARREQRLAGDARHRGPGRGWRRAPPSETWSAILSGWPSVTDSEVKRVRSLIGLLGLTMQPP